VASIARWFEFENLFAWVDLHASRWRLQRRGNPYSVSYPQYYDRQGFPIPGEEDTSAPEPEWMLPTLQWAKLHSDPDYKRVARDELPDGSYLSTVWLGLDHNFGFGGPPLFFETMRFAGDESEIHLTRPVPASMEFPDIFGEPGETTEQLRYGSEEEALAAHHEIVRRLRIREGH